MVIQHLAPKLTLVALLAFMIPMAHAQEAVPEGKSVLEDGLNTNKLPWGGRNEWVYNEAATIKDALVNTTLGKVIFDRHGIDNVSDPGDGEGGQGGLSFMASNPFASPSPGRILFISLWGSKINGCFAQFIVAYAPRSEISNILQAIVPKTLEMGINGRKVQLNAVRELKPKLYQAKYTYTVSQSNGARCGFLDLKCTSENTTTVDRSGTWYAASTYLAIDANTVSLLSNATPEQEVKARLTFNNDSTFLFPIGKGTVTSWRDAFSYNPSCTRPNNQVFVPKAGRKKVVTSTSIEIKTEDNKKISSKKVEPAKVIPASPVDKPIADKPVAPVDKPVADKPVADKPVAVVPPVLPNPAPPTPLTNSVTPPPVVADSNSTSSTSEQSSTQKRYEAGAVISPGVVSLGNIAGFEANTDDLKRAIGDLPLLDNQAAFPDYAKMSMQIAAYPKSIKNEARQLINSALKGKVVTIPNNTRRVLQRYLKFRAYGRVY